MAITDVPSDDNTWSIDEKAWTMPILTTSLAPQTLGLQDASKIYSLQTAKILVATVMNRSYVQKPPRNGKLIFSIRQAEVTKKSWLISRIKSSSLTVSHSEVKIWRTSSPETEGCSFCLSR